MKTPGDESSRPPQAEGALSPLLANLEENTRAMQRGVRMALLIHKKLGHSVVVWDAEHGTQWVLPEEIPVDDAEFEGETLVLPWW